MKFKDTERLLNSHANLVAALQAAMPFIDDADDVQQLFPESAASKRCRSAVAECHSVIVEARLTRTAIERPLP